MTHGTTRTIDDGLASRSDVRHPDTAQAQDSTTISPPHKKSRTGEDSQRSAQKRWDQLLAARLRSATAVAFRYEYPPDPEHTYMTVAGACVGENGKIIKREEYKEIAAMWKAHWGEPGGLEELPDPYNPGARKGEDTPQELTWFDDELISMQRTPSSGKKFYAGWRRYKTDYFHVSTYAGS